VIALEDVGQLHGAAYLEAMKGAKRSVATQKQHMAAVRMRRTVEGNRNHRKHEVAIGMTEDLEKPQVSIAKIGKRYYWTVYRWTNDDEAAEAYVMLMGIARDTCADARRQAEIARAAQGLGYHQVLEHSQPARVLYKLHHGKKRQAKHTYAQADLGYMYTQSEGEMTWGEWTEHRITMITKKRIFIASCDFGNSQYSFDRAEVEAKGYAFGGGNGTGRRMFFSEAGKAAAVAQSKLNRRVSLGEHGELLGLGAEFTRDDVMSAFREKAHEHHPDKGGDPAIFRRLVEARDRALRGAA
jgi:hypothetical protein